MWADDKANVFFEKEAKDIGNLGVAIHENGVREKIEAEFLKHHKSDIVNKRYKEVTYLEMR